MAHGFSWLAASVFAERNKLPLHLIVHDEWPQSAITGRIKSWMNKRFCKVYRKAASRLCVSPAMVEEYERRYGVRGTVLYPSRGYDTPCFDGIAEIQRDGSSIHDSFCRVLEYWGLYSPNGRSESDGWETCN